MRKKIFLIFIFVLTLGLCACQTPHEHVYVDGVCSCGDVEQSAVGSYEEVWEEYVNSKIPNTVEAKLGFEETFTFADGTVGFVELESSNTYSISNKGLFFTNLFDNNVTIKARLLHENGDVYEVVKEVLAKGITTEETYIEYVKSNVIPDTVFKDTELQLEEKEYFKDRGSRGVATISYESSNPNAFTKDGKYTLTTKDDVYVTLTFNITISEFTLSGTKEILVLGKNDELYVGNAKNWLENEWYKDQNVTNELELPTSDDKGMVTMTWKSLDLNIIDDNGKFNNFTVDLTFSLQVDISMFDYVETLEVTKSTISTEEALGYILDRMHYEEIYQSTFVTYIISSGYHNEDYGLLNFYTKDLDETQLIVSQNSSGVNTYGTKAKNSNASLLKVTEGMIGRNMTHKRPLIQKTSVEFITIHDTGDNKFNAAQWSNEVQTSGREASWHFTIDDTSIYQHIPLDEVAYHAGDGSHRFQLVDTGVKFTINDPVLEFSKEDNYLYINGIKSNLMAPTYDGVYYHTINASGLYTCLGENGNYFINTYHYNDTYKAIGTDGGNRNSIGIESCIVDGVKYSQVMKNLANLVAHLLTMYDLDTSRVMQHRNFSGKLCPQSMIRAKEGTFFTYDNFMELLEIEYFILNNLPNVKFTYTSNNPDILDNNGTLLKYVTEDTEVSYTVKAEFGDQVITRTYTTIIHPQA